MAEPTQAQAQSKKARPIVPFLRLGDNGQSAHLVAKKCGNCGAVYLGTRVACSKCYGSGPFNDKEWLTAGPRPVIQTT